MRVLLGAVEEPSAPRARRSRERLGSGDRTDRTGGGTTSASTVRPGPSPSSRAVVGSRRLHDAVGGRTRPAPVIALFALAIAARTPRVPGARARHGTTGRLRGILCARAATWLCPRSRRYDVHGTRRTGPPDASVLPVCTRGVRCACLPAVAPVLWSSPGRKRGSSRLSRAPCPPVHRADGVKDRGSRRRGGGGGPSTGAGRGVPRPGEGRG